MNWQQILQLLNSSTSPGWPSPTTTTSGIDLGGLLGSISSVFSPKAGNTLTTLGNVAQPLLGAGLLGAGLAQKEEPGYATESIQYLRNRLAPQGIAQQFSGQIGALAQEYQPLQEQQRNRLLDQTQQRFIAGQPSSFSTAMSGPEIALIRNAIVNEILPAERAERARIGEYLLSTGGSAAGRLLDYAKPDPLGGYLASLGMNLLGGRGGQAGQTGQGTAAQSGIGKSLLDTFGANTSIGDAISQAVGLANTAGDTSKLTALLSSGILKGTPFPIGLQASTPAGQIIQQAINAGLVESPAAIPTGAASGSGLATFLGSSLGTVLGIAGIAAGGYGIGGLVSNLGQNQFQSSAGGALGGAAAGALAGTLIFPGVGTAIGAIVGGLGGLFGGLFGERSEQHALKEANLQSDLSAHANAVQQIGSFFATSLSGSGIDPSSFMSYVRQQVEASPGPGDEQQNVAREGGRLLLQAIQRTNPTITSLNQVPGLRQSFIDQMLGTVYNAQNARAFNAEDAGSYANWAGLARGGFIHHPTNAIIGERGAEMVHLEPGSYVVPFANSLN